MVALCGRSDSDVDACVCVVGGGDERAGGRRGAPAEGGGGGRDAAARARARRPPPRPRRRTCQPGRYMFCFSAMSDLLSAHIVAPRPLANDALPDLLSSCTLLSPSPS